MLDYYTVNVQILPTFGAVSLETASPVIFFENAVDPSSLGEVKPHPCSGLAYCHWQSSLYRPATPLYNPILYQI